MKIIITVKIAEILIIKISMRDKNIVMLVIITIATITTELKIDIEPQRSILSQIF